MSLQYSGPLEQIEIERRLLLFFHTVKTPLSPKAGEPVQHRETIKKKDQHAMACFPQVSPPPQAHQPHACESQDRREW